jgi:hypothetical protein
MLSLSNAKLFSDISVSQGEEYEDDYLMGGPCHGSGR